MGPLLDSVKEMVSGTLSTGALLESASEIVSVSSSVGALLESASETLSSFRRRGRANFDDNFSVSCLRIFGILAIGRVGPCNVEKTKLYC